MRVALITELYAPHVGGQENRFKALAEGFVQRGAEVTVFTVRYEAGLAAEEVLNGVRVLRAPDVPGYVRGGAGGLVRSPMGMLRFGLATRRWLASSEPFDFLYFNQWPYLHVLFAPRRARSIAAIDWCEHRDEAVHVLPERLLPRLVRGNFCVNADTANRLGEAAGVAIGYLPSGVYRSRYESNRKDRAGFLFVGRLVANKNLPLLVNGYAEYRLAGGTEPLRIAGAGPERDRLLDIVGQQTHDVAEAIEVLGEVAEDRKVELLASSRALLLPSLREGFPNVVAEAMASGLPTVTVDSPENGTAPVVRRYGSGTVGSADPAGFASAINEALGSWDAIHARCVVGAAELDWETIVDELYAYAALPLGSER